MAVQGSGESQGSRARGWRSHLTPDVLEKLVWGVSGPEEAARVALSRETSGTPFRLGNKADLWAGRSGQLSLGDGTPSALLRETSLTQMPPPDGGGGLAKYRLGLGGVLFR